MPTFALVQDSVDGLGIALDGVVLPLSDEAIATFESTYALHCTDFFAAASCVIFALSALSATASKILPMNRFSSS